jgi:cytochrome b6-f complex iron-sulfur subunit
VIINRRQFLILTVGFAAGCKTGDNLATNTERIVNAGSVGNFAADGVYSNFRNQGFFVIRKGDKLFALSAICTHRKCKLTAEPDRSFSCPCHGSTFDPAGHVTAGPAKRDLLKFPAFPNEQGELVVNVPAV